MKDVNFEDGTIRVDESLTRLDGEDLITAPKTESSVRVITIHKELQDEIREYISTLYRAKTGNQIVCMEEQKASLSMRWSVALS